MKKSGLILLMFTIAILSACIRTVSPSPMATSSAPIHEQTNPSIRGVIRDLTFHADGSAVMTIEGTLQPNTTYDIALVGTLPDTVIFQEENSEYTVATLQDLADGLQVDAYFVGPIAASYPVQAEAGEIVILTTDE